ncbi:hypothetical protein HOY82DRAFT_602355 [Tuber indicum]|nr:hypothetical protein HOY82DRAFT_602355 [Tuber indicum]
MPPQNRAQTDTEKEQRRVGRLLRNRAAAQSSRERKRKEVEALETERARLSESNTELRAQPLAQEAANSASTEAPELSTNEDDHLFQFLVSDPAAPVSAIDPSVLEWRGAFRLSEPIIEVDGRS